MIGEVILMNVVEDPATWVQEGLDFSNIKTAQIAKMQKYLADLQSRLGLEGIKVKTEALEGGTAHSISEYAKEKAVDLIVMTTHGHTGMKELRFGSIALRVLHDAHAPVLLIRPEACKR
jgi:nucleotide-binding universal stress UspA family protein